MDWETILKELWALYEKEAKELANMKDSDFDADINYQAGTCRGLRIAMRAIVKLEKDNS